MSVCIDVDIDVDAGVEVDTDVNIDGEIDVDVLWQHDIEMMRKYPKQTELYMKHLGKFETDAELLKAANDPERQEKFRQMLNLVDEAPVEKLAELLSDKELSKIKKKADALKNKNKEDN